MLSLPIFDFFHTGFMRCSCYCCFDMHYNEIHTVFIYKTRSAISKLHILTWFSMLVYLQFLFPRWYTQYCWFFPEWCLLAWFFRSAQIFNRTPLIAWNQINFFQLETSSKNLMKYCTEMGFLLFILIYWHIRDSGINGKFPQWYKSLQKFQGCYFDCPL